MFYSYLSKLLRIRRPGFFSYLNRAGRLCVDVLCDNFGYEKHKIEANYHLGDDLGLGSLERVEFIFEIEKNMNSAIPDSVVGELDTVRKTAEYIGPHLKTGN
jgi:acyl carrier protein